MLKKKKKMDPCLYRRYYAVLCRVAQSRPTLYEPMDCSPPGSSLHGDSPDKNTGMGCHALLQISLLTFLYSFVAPIWIMTLGSPPLWRCGRLSAAWRVGCHVGGTHVAMRRHCLGGKSRFRQKPDRSFLTCTVSDHVNYFQV